MDSEPGRTEADEPRIYIAWTLNDKYKCLTINTRYQGGRPSGDGTGDGDGDGAGAVAKGPAPK